MNQEYTSAKTVMHITFESLMFADIENFNWNEDLELYEDESTQLAWLTFLTVWDFKHKTMTNSLEQEQKNFKKTMLSTGDYKEKEFELNEHGDFAWIGTKNDFDTWLLCVKSKTISYGS